MEEIAVKFNVHYSTVIKTIRKTEDHESKI